MPNEREVKMGYRSSKDNLTTAFRSRLKTLLVHLDVCKDDIDWCQQYDDGLERIWPQPELRDIRRKLETATAMVKEILG